MHQMYAFIGCSRADVCTAPEQMLPSSRLLRLAPRPPGAFRGYHWMQYKVFPTAPNLCPRQAPLMSTLLHPSPLQRALVISAASKWSQAPPHAMDIYQFIHCLPHPFQQYTLSHTPPCAVCSEQRKRQQWKRKQRKRQQQWKRQRQQHGEWLR